MPWLEHDNSVIRWKFGGKEMEVVTDVDQKISLLKQDITNYAAIKCHQEIKVWPLLCSPKAMCWSRLKEIKS